MAAWRAAAGLRQSPPLTPAATVGYGHGYRLPRPVDRFVDRAIGANSAIRAICGTTPWYPFS
jgi:hypothetical protein